MTFGRWIFNVSMAVCIVWGVRFISPAAAAAEKAPKEEAWKAERRKLEQVVEERLKEELAKSVSKKEVAKKLGLKWPVKKPPKSKDEVAAIVEKELDKEAAIKFPESKREEFEKEAEEKYKLYERGDIVEFSIRDGVGPNAKIRGRFYGKTSMRLKIGSRYVLRSDMKEEDAARFWEDLSEEYKNKYIRVQNIRYDAKIEAYKDQLRKVRLPQALQAARYVCDPRVKGEARLNLKNWHALSDVVDYIYKKQKEAFEKKKRPQITEEVFTSNGYVLVEDEASKTKEWMPKQEAKSFRERLKALLEKKKAEEAAKKKKAAMGPGGMPGEGGMMGPGGGMPGGAGGMPGAAGGMPGGAGGVPGGEGAMMGAGGGMPGGAMGAPGGKPGAGAGKKDGKAAGGKNPFDEDPW